MAIVLPSRSSLSSWSFDASRWGDNSKPWMTTVVSRTLQLVGHMYPVFICLSLQSNTTQFPRGWVGGGLNLICVHSHSGLTLHSNSDRGEVGSWLETYPVWIWLSGMPSIHCSDNTTPRPQMQKPCTPPTGVIVVAYMYWHHWFCKLKVPLKGRYFCHKWECPRQHGSPQAVSISIYII